MSPSPFFFPILRALLLQSGNIAFKIVANKIRVEITKRVQKIINVVVTNLLNTGDTAYRPGGGSFGTLCGGNPCMSLCCLWALCNGGRLLVLLLRDHKRGSRDHMIKSMTGYGRARQELHKRDITVEVRSVNNRYLDCTVKMPRMYAFAETR